MLNRATSCTLRAIAIMTLCYLPWFPAAAGAAQPLSGTVTTPDGQPVAGAHVRFEHTRAATITDASGAFHLNGTPGVVLVQAAGMESREVLLTDTPAHVVLHRTADRAPGTIITRVLRETSGEPATAVLLDRDSAVTVWRGYENAAAPLVPAYAKIGGGQTYETNVTLDGTPITSVSSAAFDLALLPSYLIGQAYIVHGPGQDQSVNGTLALQTRDTGAPGFAGVQTALDAQGGSFSDLRSTGGSADGRLAYTALLGVDGAAGPLRDTPIASNALRRSLFVKVRDLPNRSLMLTGTLLATNLDRGLLGEFATTGSSGSSLFDRIDTIDRFRFAQIAADFGHGRDTYGVRLGSTLVGGALANAPFSTGLFEIRNSVHAAWTHALPRNAYTLALDASRGEGQSDEPYRFSLAPGSSDARVALSADAQLHPNAHDEIDLSGTIGNYHGNAALNFGDGFSGPRFTPWARYASARAAFTRAITSGFSLHASYGVSGLVPPLWLLTNGIPQYLETTVGSQLGAAWQLRRTGGRLGVDLYRTAVHHPYVGMGYSTPTRIDEGLEAAFSRQAARGFAYEARVALPRSYYPGHFHEVNLSSIPYAHAYGEVEYTWERGARVRFGTNYFGANNPYLRPAFAMSNALIALPLRDRWQVHLIGENLFNEASGVAPVLVPLSNRGALIEGVAPARTLRVMITTAP